MCSRFFIALLLLSAFGNCAADLSNLYSDGEQLTLELYVSDRSTLDVGRASKVLDTIVRYGAADAEEQVSDVSVNLTKSMQHNATIYGHFVLTPVDEARRQAGSLRASVKLNEYVPRKSIKRVRSLLFDDASSPESSQDATDDRYVSVWRTRLGVCLVGNFATYPSLSAVPELQRRFIRQVDAPREAGKKGAGGKRFAPIMYVNTINHVDQQRVPVNDTIDAVPLSVSFSTITADRWEWLLKLEQTYKMQESWMTGEDMEQIKQMFLEVNPVLLYATAAVSALHLVFDFLAFKNDVSFCCEADTLRGLSARSVFFNVFCQAVILLHLLDNETSILVLGTVGVGLLVELWKITRVWKIRGRKQTRDELDTEEYDTRATRYLLASFAPIVVGYSIYSLIYDLHSGWYSWALNSLVAVVYTLGFVRMTPQLFINYKLKTVAAMPWRSFGYKALNTFIDDLFAFIIKMPTMHRLSCFRDDIIFLIFLYQRWIYPTDHSRVNEFGQTGETSEKKTKKTN